MRERARERGRDIKDGTERGQTEGVRKVATSCWVFPELGGGRGGEGHSAAALWGVLGSVKEMKAGDGLVLLASVCEKRRYAEMKGEMG